MLLNSVFRIRVKCFSVSVRTGSKMTCAQPTSTSASLTSASTVTALMALPTTPVPVFQDGRDGCKLYLRFSFVLFIVYQSNFCPQGCWNIFRARRRSELSNTHWIETQSSWNETVKSKRLFHKYFQLWRGFRRVSVKSMPKRRHLRTDGLARQLHMLLHGRLRGSQLPRAKGQDLQRGALP